MTTIERFDIPLGDLTFRALHCGPKDGRPVVLLHGVPQTSICWSAQLQALGAAGYHAVAFDQRGYSPGARPGNVEDYTMFSLVGDLLGIADTLGFERFDLVGHDMGAGVAWSAALAAPQRLTTLTTLSVPHPRAMALAYHGRLTEPEGSEGQYERSAYARGFRDNPRGEFEKLMLADDCAMLRAILDGLPPDHVAEYLDTLGSVEALTAMLDVYRNAFLSDDPDKDIARVPSGPITVPTLFFWSDGDVAIAAAGAHATAEFVSAPYEFVVVNGVDHWIPEKAPELVNQKLLAHLAREPKPAA